MGWRDLLAKPADSTDWPTPPPKPPRPPVEKQQTGAPPYKPAPTPLLSAKCSNPAAFVTGKSKLDWVLDYADKGFFLFPVEEFLGRPLLDRWYRDATNKRATLVEWWSRFPGADIACVPDLFECYAIAVTGNPGRDSLKF
jgi:hypothetical protein